MSKTIHASAKKLDKKTLLQLALVFAAIYFFSPNGLAALPGLTISFLLKDTLKMTASQVSYFSALTIAGWAVKPVWGIISDMFPIFGYRRKSYLIVTTIAAAVVWFTLGQINHYTVSSLLVLFTLSSLAYAFMDVLCDALMVEKGKPAGLTDRFQAVQWTAVYVASIITGYAGGLAAQQLRPQTVFSLNAVFPLIILVIVLIFVQEKRIANTRKQARESWTALKRMLRDRTTWLIGSFLFFVTFSPSTGAPFFYYAVDKLKFDPVFLGMAASIGAVSTVVGSVLYGFFSKTMTSRRFIKWIIVLSVIFTFYDLVYFAPYLQTHLPMARAVYIGSAAVLGALSAFTFLVMLNVAAQAVPLYSEGTAFALLTSFWNIGQIGSDVLGGFLFGKIGLQPLIVVSALFTAAAWLFLPFLHFPDDKNM